MIRKSIHTYQQAINKFCARCKNYDTFAVANCAFTRCELYEFRPNKLLKGTSREELDTEDTHRMVSGKIDFYAAVRNAIENGK